MFVSVPRVAGRDCEPSEVRRTRYSSSPGTRGPDASRAGGLTEQYIGVIERGDRAPSFKTLEALAKALKTPVRDFFPHPSAPDEVDEALADVISLLSSRSANEQSRAFKVLQSMFGEG